MKTRVGMLELLVSKDGDGQFQTELFARYPCSEKALVLAIVQMYGEGVSPRNVRQITEVLWGLEISKSQVSLLAKNLDEEILAVYQLPAPHRRRLRSTNLLERHSQEIKRRTRVVRIFPDEAARLRLICALAMEANVEWLERVYLRMDQGTTTEELVEAGARC